MITQHDLDRWETGGVPVHNAHLSAFLPAGLKAAAQRAAAEVGCSLSQLVRLSLLDRLRAEHPHLIEAEGGG